jgi:hypothetical protein
MLPRFVKICTTPLFAREPYSAAAAAPRVISTRSISLGLRSARRFCGFDRVPRSASCAELLSTITPSTMYSGSEPEMNEFVPRSRTETPPPPGMPEFWVICAPATLPWSARSTVSASLWLMSDESTVAILVPTFRFSVAVPVPVTTISLRFTALTEIAISPTALSPALTSIRRVAGW